MLSEGAIVRVRDFQGHLLEKVVTGVTSTGVMVTSPEELDRATKEHREPLSVGYPKEDVMEV